MGGLRPGLDRRRRVAAAVTAVALAFGTVAPARAGQIAASKDPKVSGPLSVKDWDCLRDKARYKGTTIARMQLCVWFYEFDKTMEVDLARNYGVAWVQNTVDAVNGWCAAKVESNIKLPSNVKRHAYVPKRKVVAKKRRRATVRLEVTANGSAVEDGKVVQSFGLFPKTWTPSLANEGRTIRATWAGRESSKLAFALGAEISWAQGDEIYSSPSISGGLGSMRFVKSRRC